MHGANPGDWLCAQLRLRMDRANDDDRAFHPLSSDLAALRHIFFDPAQGDVELKAAIAKLRARLETCRQAVNGVYTHFEENAISVGIVSMLRQLRERIVRVRELLDTLTSAALRGHASAASYGRVGAVRLAVFLCPASDDFLTTW